MNTDYKIYALRGPRDDEQENQEWTKKIYSSLKDGEGRFGYSNIKTADLNELKKRIEKDGWDSLSGSEDNDERACYQNFLLDLNEGDYVVYINMPEWGKCTLARVTKPYYWKYDDKDFNHRFGVDSDSVVSFNRNDKLVYPSLSAKLKLRKRWWGIRGYHQRFEALIEGLNAGEGGQLQTDSTRRVWLQKEIEPLLTKITGAIHDTHPNKDLEAFLAAIFAKVPGVTEVEKKGGPRDRGADLLVHFETAMPMLPQTCVIQVKSFEGEHWDTRAVDDIKRAFEAYPEATMGLIVSTAAASTNDLDKAIENLEEETGKSVSLLIGKAVADYVLRYGIDD